MLTMFIETIHTKHPR